MSQKTIKVSLSKANVNAIAGAIGSSTLRRLVPAFSTSASYEKGQYTNYNNVLYRFTADKSAGAWDSTKVESASLNDLINDVNAAVASVTGKANIVDLETGALVPAKAQVAQSLATTLGKLDKTPFAYMSSGGQTDIETGIQKTLKLVGVDVVKNQHYNQMRQTFTLNGITATNNGDGSFTLNGTNTDSNDYFDMPLVYADSVGDIPLGSKILIGSPNLNVNGIRYLITTNGQSTGYQTNKGYMIFETIGSILGAFILRIENGASFTNLKIVPTFVNLTQRYGSNDVVNAIIGTGTQEEQVANLLNFDPSILEDTDFDEGSFPTIKTASIKSDGYNVWDEEWIAVSNVKIKNKNPIRVKGNTKYYPYYGGRLIDEWGLRIVYFDKDLNSLGSAWTGNRVFTTPVNCMYIGFETNAELAITTYQNDICIFEYWDGSRIGYEKHEEKIEPMPNVELHGILKVDDNGNVYADGDELYPDHTNNKKRTYKFTLRGNTYNLVKNINADADDWLWYVVDSSNFGEVSGLVLSDKFVNHGYAPVGKSGGECAYSATYHALYINFYGLANENTRESIQQWLNANEPVFIVSGKEQELEANDFNENLWADDFGHLQCLDEDGNEIVGLQGVEILYRANVAGFAESLYERAEGEPSNVVVESERTADNLARDTIDTQLKNALGGTLRQLLASSKNIDFLNTDFVDLGELNWSFDTNHFVAPLSDTKLEGYCVCSALKSITYAERNYSVEDTIWLHNTHEVFVTITGITDATAFKNAMKGVLLAYEKASS